MKGHEALAAHLPELNLGRGLWVGLIIVTSFTGAGVVMLVVDRLGAAWSIAGHVLVLALGFLWSAQFYWRRRDYQAHWGERAYRITFVRHMLTGAPVMFAAIAHTAWLPGERLLPDWTTPATALLGLYLALTGLLLYVRSYIVFGVDYLAALYVYVPNESRLVDTSIYAVLRHPAYSGLARLGLALGLWGGTPASLAFGLCTPLGLTLWLRLVEEPELIERFGAGYADYRRRVPAFWPRLRDAGQFLSFLLTDKG